jgi:hypothetical protein
MRANSGAGSARTDPKIEVVFEEAISKATEGVALLVGSLFAIASAKFLVDSAPAPRRLRLARRSDRLPR